MASKSGRKLVKNVGIQAYALPNGQYLPAGGEAIVADWDSQAENETVKQWLADGDLELEDAGPDPEQEARDKEREEEKKRRQEERKKSEGGSSGSSSASTSSASGSKTRSPER